jgi:type II secretory ATPase GspE/PulE/Tfp pilus assembly ATPase PilB-like protein
MNSGYKGRISIYELMIPDDGIRNAILAKSSADEIRKLARSSGMTTLMEDGVDKIKSGMTSIEEVLRVTREE